MSKAKKKLSAVAAEGVQVGVTTDLTSYREQKFAKASKLTRRWKLTGGSLYNPDLISDLAEVDSVIDEASVSQDALTVAREEARLHLAKHSSVKPSQAKLAAGKQSFLQQVANASQAMKVA